jgi:uncharacterized protein with HEPN domain
MENNDLVRLRHMLESGQAILLFAKGRRRNDLDKDRLFLSGVIRELEIVGEAASKISIKIRKQFPQIPWQEIVGMRNRLIHAYFDIDHDIVWKTIREFLPLLIQEASKIIHLLENDSSE